MLFDVFFECRRALGRLGTHFRIAVLQRGTAMLGNYKPAEISRSERDISLGNFEPTNKKQDNSEKN